MKKYTLTLQVVSVLFLFISCSQTNNKEIKLNESTEQSLPKSDQKSGQNNAIESNHPVYLSTADFKTKVWNFETNPQEFIYQGELPCIIDFYADWCKPCKMVAPIMDELAEYYKGRVIVYKVNTDKERELASVFQITSIPTIFFAPKEGKPAIQPGALKKEDYIKIIDEFILNNKSENSL